MVHGGTNFGFWSGANTGAGPSDFQPDITSYDYVSTCATTHLWCLSFVMHILGRELGYFYHSRHSLVLGELQVHACLKTILAYIRDVKFIIDKLSNNSFLLHSLCF